MNLSTNLGMNGVSHRALRHQKTWEIVLNSEQKDRLWTLQDTAQLKS